MSPYLLLFLFVVVTESTIRTFHWRSAATVAMDYTQAVKTGSRTYKMECLSACNHLPHCGGSLTSSYTNYDTDICIHLTEEQVGKVVRRSKPGSRTKITEISEYTIKIENTHSNLNWLETVLLKLYVTEADKDFCRSMKKACESVTNPSAACSLYVYSRQERSAVMFLAFKDMVSLHLPKMASPRHLVDDSRNCRIFWTEANTGADRSKKPRVLKVGRINTTETETLATGDFYGLHLDRVPYKLYALAMDVLTCQLFQFDPETGKKEHILPFTCTLHLKSNTMGDPVEKKFYFIDKGFFSGASLNYILYGGQDFGKFSAIKKLKSVPTFYLAVHMRRVYYVTHEADKVSVFHTEDKKDEMFVSCPRGKHSGPPMKGGEWGDLFYLLCDSADGDTYLVIYSWEGTLVDEKNLSFGPVDLEISV